MSIHRNTTYRRLDLLDRPCGASGYERSDRSSDLAVSVDEGLERLGENAKQHRLVDMRGFVGSPFGIVGRALPHVSTIGRTRVPGLMAETAPAALALDSSRQSQTKRTVSIGVNAPLKPSVTIGTQAVPSTVVKVGIPRILPSENSLRREVLQDEVRERPHHPGLGCHLGFKFEREQLTLLHFTCIVVLHTRSKEKNYQADTVVPKQDAGTRPSVNLRIGFICADALRGSSVRAERRLSDVD